MEKSRADLACKPWGSVIERFIVVVQSWRPEESSQQIASARRVRLLQPTGHHYKVYNSRTRPGNADAAEALIVIGQEAEYSGHSSSAHRFRSSPKHGRPILRRAWFAWEVRAGGRDG